MPRRRPFGPKEATLASSSPPFLGVEMSGLSHPEREGCRNLLGLLDNSEIVALCDTITNRLVQPENRQGKDRRFSPKAAAPPQASPRPPAVGAEELRGFALSPSRNAGEPRPPPVPWGRNAASGCPAAPCTWRRWLLKAALPPGFIHVLLLASACFEESEYVNSRFKENGPKGKCLGNQGVFHVVSIS